MEYLDSLLAALGSRPSRFELVFEDGQGRRGRYVGEVRDGKANGYGRWVCDPDGKCVSLCATQPAREACPPRYAPEYTGDFVDNQMHGRGVKRWTSGEYAGNSYHGGFRRDKKHGPGGVYTWANGDVFRGSWCDGPRHGPGVFFRAADGAEERRTYARGALVEEDGIAHSAYYPRV